MEYAEKSKHPTCPKCQGNNWRINPETFKGFILVKGLVVPTTPTKTCRLCGYTKYIKEDLLSVDAE